MTSAADTRRAAGATLDGATTVSTAPPPGRAGLFSAALRRLETARRAGFTHDDGGPRPAPFHPLCGGHDEGPLGLFCLGGVGAGNFGRDLEGRFSRWRLENGYRRRMPVDAASLALRWTQGDRSGAWRLGSGDWDRPLPEGVRSVHALFPVVTEHLKADDWPVEIVVEGYSPIVAGDPETSCLPVAFFDVHARNVSDAPADLDMAFFWPNLLGWSPGMHAGSSQPSLCEPAAAASRRRNLVWLEPTNGGNTCRAVDGAAEEALRKGIRFCREPFRLPRRALEGEWFLGVAGDAALRASRHLCYRAFRGATEVSPLNQTGPEEDFFSSGRFSDSDLRWRAQYHEVLCGALAGGVSLAPGEDASWTFVLAWDLPLTEAGSGRTWRKEYTRRYGCDGANAARIARDALAAKDDWRDRIEDWRRSLLEGAQAPFDDPALGGALVNETYFLVDGGAHCVAAQHDAAGLPAPRLGEGPHFTILEGYDQGYYYLSTFDLWPHAMIPFARHWPELGDRLFEDFIKAAALGTDEARPYYKTGHVGPLLQRFKIPHDIGSPPHDPWHEINEYQIIIDSNLWKDHNPLFLVSYYLHRVLTGRPCVSDEQWRLLKELARHMATQDRDGDGLPEHDTYGDSTWDALEVAGPAIYSSSLTVAAWMAMTAWAEDRDDVDAGRYAETRDRAIVSFERHFWNGHHYRNSTVGDRADWVFCDGLFGFLLAMEAGLGLPVPVDHARSHMRAVYESNFRGHDDGRWGPTLQAPPGGWENGEPGGIQVDEVLVGSAWSGAALMARVGLKEEACEIARALVEVLYGESGLQFRTPAAWTRERGYRAPLNLRPMAIWHFSEAMRAPAP